jgi:hypothetical protein
MSHIIGGVYLGGDGGEAVAVDGARDDVADDLLLLQLFRARLAPEIRRLHTEGNLDEDTVLLAIHTLVRQVMRSDEAATNTIIRACIEQNDDKIHLGVFLRYGVGACRHQALLAAYLVEKVQQHFPGLLLKGDFSVDRNAVTLPEGEAGHAWVRYIKQSGEVGILDPTRARPPTRLKELMEDESAWFYARPEDLKTSGRAGG